MVVTNKKSWWDNPKQRQCLINVALRYGGEAGLNLLGAIPGEGTVVGALKLQAVVGATVLSVRNQSAVGTIHGIGDFHYKAFEPLVTAKVGVAYGEAAGEMIPIVGTIVGVAGAGYAAWEGYEAAQKCMENP